MPSFRDFTRPSTLAEEVERRYADATKLAGPKKPPKLKTFHLNRIRDESGVSGTGVVAVGVVLPSNRCIIEWVSKRTNANSLGIYDNMDDLKEVHGHAGATEVVFDDEEEEKDEET